MTGITIATGHLSRLCPQAAPEIVAGIVEHQPLLDRYGIDTPLRLCHLMAQLAHESAGFRTTREYASGAAYEGRKDLGNTRPGDGRRYRGRGLIQLTGRANYRRVGAIIGLPLENDPELGERFPAALLTALVYWQDRRINRLADRDDVEAVTRAINGGFNGLAERRRYLATAKAIWMGGSGPVDVRAAQSAINRAIPVRLPLIEDGAAGPATAAGVRLFQRLEGLPVTGQIDARTRHQLGV